MDVSEYNNIDCEVLLAAIVYEHKTLGQWTWQLCRSNLKTTKIKFKLKLIA